MQQYQLLLTWQTDLLESRNTLLNRREWEVKGTQSSSGKKNQTTKKWVVCYKWAAMEWAETDFFKQATLVPCQKRCSKTQPFLVLCPTLEAKWQLLLCDIALAGTKLGHGNKGISYADDIVTQELAQPMLLMWDVMSEWICEHHTLSLGYCWPLSFVICHHESSFGSTLS